MGKIFFLLEHYTIALNDTSRTGNTGDNTEGGPRVESLLKVSTLNEAGYVIESIYCFSLI